MYTNNLLNEFELIVSLKTKIFDINLNFLDLEDLMEIEEIAYDSGLEDILTDYDLESIYNSEYDKIEEIYKQWCQDVFNAFDNIYKRLNELN